MKILHKIIKYLFPKNETLISKKEEYTERIIARVERDLTQNRVAKAISRYEGFLSYDYNNEIVHGNLARLYSQTGEIWNAGKHYLFKPNLTVEETKELLFFKSSLGNSSINIFKAALPKDYSNIEGLSQEVILRLRDLINQSIQEDEQTPNFLKGLSNAIDRWATRENSPNTTPSSSRQ